MELETVRTPTLTISLCDDVGDGAACPGGALPSALRAALRESIVDADLDRILELTGQVEAHSPELARHVSRLASAFANEELLALVTA